MIPGKEAVLATMQRVAPHVHRTPVLTATSINTMVGGDVYFKCENFQKMGAFKMRGATNAIAQLSAQALEKGVATHSSGNFAQALALSAKAKGIKAYIVMPNSAPTIKKTAVLGYGAEVIESGPTLKDRETMLEQVIEKTGATFIHPSNNMDVILGQGTAAHELIEEVPALNYIITPVGGGGLIGGTALATHYLSPTTKVIGGEPFGADDAYHSLKAGKIIPPENPQTIADGLRTALGDQNFPIIQQHVTEIIRVEEEEIIAAMRTVWERMKIIIEPSSAVALAALLRNKEQFKGQRVGLIVSGGNVDLNQLPF